jgi:hypothetical protein
MGNLLCGRAEPESELGPSGGQGKFVCMALVEQHCVVVARRLSPLDAHILSHMSSYWNIAVRPPVANFHAIKLLVAMQLARSPGTILAECVAWCAYRISARFHII